MPKRKKNHHKVHNQNRKNQKASNSRLASDSGASGLGDRGNGYFPARQHHNAWQQDKIYSDLFYTDWQAKKIVTIPVDDMLRNGWKYTGIDDNNIKKLTAYQKNLGLSKTLRQALMLERLQGGCVIFLGVADGLDNPELPLLLGSIVENSLKFANVIPRNRISKIEIDNNPLSANYGRPSHYWVNGQSVHRSRLLIFDGDPLLPVPDIEVSPINIQRNDGFGTSVLMGIYDDLMRATGSRQAAFHLVNMASILILSGDFQSLLESNKGNDVYSQLQSLTEQISIFKGAIIDKNPGVETSLHQLSANFGSVPELLMSFLQVLSAASDIPATRFLGQAPGGLNATGDSDLENYYNMIEAKRTSHLEPQLIKLLDILGRSAIGKLFNKDDVEINFAPLWNMSNVDKSQVAENYTNSITKLTDTGILSPNQAYDELKNLDVIAGLDAFQNYSKNNNDMKLSMQLQGLSDGANPTQQSKE